MAETGKARSFQDILHQNQEFIAHLQALQEDVSRQLAEKQKELDELQNAQLQWAVDRQGLLDQHQALKQMHEDLKASHDRTRSELTRVQEEAQRVRGRDEEIKQLEREKLDLVQAREAGEKK